MQCKKETEKHTYKWFKPYKGKVEIYLKKEGVWEKWCSKKSFGDSKKDDWDTKRKIEFVDNGARCKTEKQKYFFEPKLLSQHIDTNSYIDFELFESVQKQKYTTIYSSLRDDYVRNEKRVFECKQINKP